MQSNPNSKSNGTTFCHSCGSYVPTANFLLHEGRCQRLSELRSSKVSQSSQHEEKPYFQKKQQTKPEESRRQPYSFSKMNIKEEIGTKREKSEQEKIPCPFCGYMQTLMQLDTHPTQCQHREVQCNFCGTRYPNSLMDDHVQICSKNPLNIQRNQRNQQRNQMRRNSPQQYHHEQQDEDMMPMFFQPRHRDLYSPSPLMDIFNHPFFGGSRQRQPRNPFQQQLMGPSMQVFQYTSNNGRPQVIIRSNSANPSTFIQLIEMLTRRMNPNQNPGLNEQQLSRLAKVKYHKKNEEPDLCTICYCEFEQNEEIIELQCKHMFHQECIFEWLKRVSTCPVCKKKLKPNNRSEQQQFEEYQQPNSHHGHQHRYENYPQNYGGR